MEVCDALPQRNCGRFSRPSLLTESYEKEQPTPAPHRRAPEPASRIPIFTHQRMHMRRYV